MIKNCYGIGNNVWKFQVSNDEICACGMHLKFMHNLHDYD